MSQMSVQDLNFIKAIDTDLADLVLDVCILNIADLHKLIKSSESLENKITQDLTESKLDEMLVFYESLLDILVDREMFEECSKLSDILNYLKKEREKVGAN
jgi:uncharacterized protein YjgD (DUF1641 family)